MTVLVGNEVWKATFFGRRSTRNGFIGLLVFLVPLIALQRSVREDPGSLRALAPYIAFVLLYDLPWTVRAEPR